MRLNIYNKQEITPSSFNGVNYGRPCRVLIREGANLLMFVPGQRAWSGTGMPWRYAPAHIIYVGPNHTLRRAPVEGGREASLVKLQSTREFAAKYFGADAAFNMRAGRTVVVE